MLNFDIYCWLIAIQHHMGSQKHENNKDMFVVNELGWYVIVRFIGICWNVDHQCLKLLFIISIYAKQWPCNRYILSPCCSFFFSFLLCFNYHCSLCCVFPMLPVSLNCSFSIVSSGFSNVYCHTSVQTGTSTMSIWNMLKNYGEVSLTKLNNC